MTDPALFIAYLVAASLLTITPGVDTAMVLRQAGSGGPRSAVFAAVGIGLGCLVWGVGTALGLGVLLTASELAYTAVKWIGAAYLAWLGAGLILRPRGRFADSAEPAQARGSTALTRGLLTNLLNPKVGLFYAAFLPQFIPAGADVALWSILLTAVHVLIGLVWFAILIAATLPLTRWLKRPGVVRAMDRITGCVFVGFAVKLAASER